MSMRTAPVLGLFSIAICTWSATAPPTAPPNALPTDDVHRGDRFTLSQECAVCHLGAPGATAMRSKAGEDVSPYGLWQATMMGNAFRDPYFHAQLQKESAVAGEQVQELCLRCHTPMSHHDRVLDGEAPPRLADVADDMLADDGVSCTVCHMIEDEGLGDPSTWSGRPKFTDERVIFGPYADVFPQPMRMQVNYTPTQGLQIRKAALCATCHTLFTEHHGTPFPEQTPYLEWRNSQFNDEVEGADEKKTRTCQQCHMPATGATRIARNPMGRDFERLPARDDYRGHAFVGGNAFMLDMLRENSDELAVLADDESLERMAKATRDQLAERTARLAISPLVRDGDTLQFSIEVENLTGHKFPTGYPARRAWLHVEVLVDGKAVFQSGGWDDEGRLVGVDDELALPHVDTISSPSDVVVYEMVATDPDGKPTTYLTKMVGKQKDSRLLPRGWSSEGPHIADIAPVGLGGDTDFVGGSDRVACRVTLPEQAVGKCTVRVSLRYQSVPPAWVDPLRSVDADAARRFVRMYDAAQKQPELVATASCDEG